MKIGVLAIQGSFSLHKATLQKLGTTVVEVRKTKHLEGLEGLIIPGGESTTFQILLSEGGLREVLIRQIRSGLPVWGTCAGAIILGRGMELPQPRFELIDVVIKRNAYGRQVDSFVAPLNISGFKEPFNGVFIRAPRFTEPGEHVKILASLRDEAVMIRQESIMVTSFHPELASDDRIHRYFLDEICSDNKLRTLSSAV